jgi:hypothetical protein
LVVIRINLLFFKMIESTKITLSAKELELVCNTDWILTKHSIIEKVYSIFGNLASTLQTQINNSNLPQEIKDTTPKISRGENYLRLPYVMLDYPRYFKPEKTIAIRTFFWWGNSVSIHLLISGEHKTKVENNFQEFFKSLQEKNYAVCVADTQWQHHFENDNYLLLKDCTATEFSDILHRKPFIKIGKEIALEQWNEIPEFLECSFIEMLQMV